MALIGSTGSTPKKKKPIAKLAKKAEEIPAMKLKKAARRAAPVMRKGKPAPAGAIKYLTKSSGTTKKEVRGVLQGLRKGSTTKGAAIKALKGGPTAGVKAGNKKKVAKAIRRAR